ncbi:probable helicase senataxin isoform X2 [Microplitis mediator]|uniref:probable helicase senataxin isoform X2 n=1 Tax=Microplitis mediator TaxID=375433 RepID=UPI00255300D9|nr:probable helicase senataxin isoform X2 [Microplitis mediator]
MLYYGYVLWRVTKSITKSNSDNSSFDTKPRTKYDYKSHSQYCYEPHTQYYYEFFRTIFDWNPSWIFDNQYKNTPPATIDLIRMTPVALKYSTLEEYQKIMFPLLINEFWHSLKRDIAEDMDYLQCNKYVTGCATRTSSRCTSNTIRFQWIITCSYADKLGDEYPSRGNLVIIKYGISHQLAYVEEVEKRGDKRKLTTTFTYALITKYDPKLSLSGPLSLTTLTSILSTLALIDVLDNISNSPLINAILQPKFEPYTLCTAIENISTVTGETLNLKQWEIMSRVVSTVEYIKTRIGLIQGPPGTGKSTVIKNIIASTLSRRKTARILVCAPSNKAVDGIVIRLLEIQSQMKAQGIPFEIVRIGCIDRIDEKVKCVSLSNLKSIRKNQHLFNINNGDKTIEESILVSANIIACTLTSCYTNFHMKSVFKSGGFSFCIVDEAAQATELLTLVPLMLNINKLILVGDPQQLPPTVLSQKVKDYGYNQSLFARAQKIFESENDIYFDNPVVMLDTQYRMVEAISQWPNQYFYKGAIKNAASVGSSNFHNYRVLNHSYSQSFNGESNENEAKLVLQLVRILKNDEVINYPKTNKEMSIGIITPYQQQRTLLMKHLQNENNKIEINTVDSFQGSECDIIIMSCVKSKGIGFVKDPNRLNVSLTRAKHTLILCGNFRTFRRNKMWQNLLNDAESRGLYYDIPEKKNVQIMKNIILKGTNDNFINNYEYFNNENNIYRYNNKIFQIIIHFYNVIISFVKCLFTINNCNNNI